MTTRKTLYKLIDPILKPLMATVRTVEQFFGPDDDWVEDDRRILFEAAQKRFGHLHTFVTERSDREYYCTVSTDANSVERMLMGSGYYQRNFLSNRKYRTVGSDETKQWAVSSLVYDPPHTDSQHHVYLFEVPNGDTDIYSHTETSVREGTEHLTEPQEDATAGPLPKILHPTEHDCYDRQF